MADRTPNGAVPHYYPVFLDLRGRRCVVVGGGQVASRKVAGLVEAGAEVLVVAPHVDAMPDGVIVRERPFEPADLDEAVLVIAATDDPAVNAAVAREAEARHLLVNVVDDPEQCSVIMPAVVRRGAFCIAISTAGASPTLAKRLRQQLEAHYGPEYGELVEMLWRLRKEWEPRAAAANMPYAARAHAWNAVLDLPLPEMLRAHQRQQAEALARSVLEAALPAHEDAPHTHDA